MGDFHKSSGYQRLRRQFKERCRRIDARCYLCELRGNHDQSRIDYGASRTGDSFELDHLYPVERFPELAMESTFWRPAHQACNRQKHTKDVEQQQVWQVPDW
jgi:hypothetical protein